MEEIKADLKEIKKDVGVIKVTLAKNTESLIFHSERTYINERRIEKVEYWLIGLLSAMVLAEISKSFFK